MSPAVGSPAFITGDPGNSGCLCAITPQPGGGAWPTYIVHTPPNAYVNGNPHWSPAHIYVPVHTTVEFANDDPDQQHTVTSGIPGSQDAGKLFDSGVILYSGAFQYTFNTAGDYPYFCKLHP